MVVSGRDGLHFSRINPDVQRPQAGDQRDALEKKLEHQEIADDPPKNGQLPLMEIKKNEAQAPKSEKADEKSFKKQAAIKPKIKKSGRTQNLKANGCSTRAVTRRSTAEAK